LVPGGFRGCRSQWRGSRQPPAPRGRGARRGGGRGGKKKFYCISRLVMTPGVTVNFFRFFGDGRFFPYFGLVIFFEAEIFWSPIGLKFLSAMAPDVLREHTKFQARSSDGSQVVSVLVSILLGPCLPVSWLKLQAQRLCLDPHSSSPGRVLTKEHRLMPSEQIFLLESSLGEQSCCPRMLSEAPLWKISLHVTFRWTCKKNKCS
jgi:hypothetical protein